MNLLSDLRFVRYLRKVCGGLPRGSFPVAVFVCRPESDGRSKIRLVSPFDSMDADDRSIMEAMMSQAVRDEVSAEKAVRELVAQ